MQLYGIVISRRALRIAVMLSVSVLVIASVAGAVWWFFVYEPQNAKNNAIISQLGQITGSKNFEVEQIVVNTQGWELARILSTAHDSKGNRTLVILHEENGQMVIKFGPGTYFQKATLDASGVPRAIEDALYGNEQQITDPIVDYLPYQTNLYSVVYSGAYQGPGGSNEQMVHQTLLTVTIYVAPRFNITDTPEREAQYTSEINTWIRSLGLDPANYHLIFTT